VESGDLERLAEVVEVLADRPVGSRALQQPVDGVHPEPDGFHVKCSDRPAQGVAFIQQDLARRAGRQCLEHGAELVELL
jgi:hypothetical protein